MRLEERIVWSRPTDFSGVELLSAENNRRSWCVYHETYTLCALEEFVENPAADVGWVYRRQLHRNPARSLMLIEPGEIHRNPEPPPTCNFKVLLFDPRLVSEIAGEIGLRSNPHLHRAVTSDPRLYRGFLQLYASLNRPSDLLHRQCALAGCIGSLLTDHGETTVRPARAPARSALRLARDYLHGHFPDKVSLDELAALAGLSRFHFLRAFAREFGLPPHTYQINLRIWKVRQRLHAGVPLDAIEAGFVDQSHLIRHFKHVTGVTPGQYAAMVGRPRTVSLASTRTKEQ